MKQSIIIAIICLFAVTAIAQNEKIANQIEVRENSSVAQVLTSYYTIKDALVNGNNKLAASGANAFLQTLNAVDPDALRGKEKETFISLKPKLADDATKIAQVKKIEEQRTSFASLSLNMWDVVKAAEYQGTPIYQQYCPMKKTYWISREPAIKNPYYGKQMLTCGKVTDTIK
jgi:hypothetical protein